MEKKDKLLQIRVSENFYEQLKKNAEVGGVKVSELVRDAIESIPTPINEDMIKKGKIHTIAGVIWSIVNSTSRLRENYDYEPSFNIPEEETVLKMYDDDTFNEIKISVLNYIVSEINIKNKIDSKTDAAIKNLIKNYVSK